MGPAERRRAAPGRRLVALGALGALVLAYAVLDVVDAVPGVLTTRPVPPPAPTETVAPRTAPLVAQPSPPTSAAVPLPALAGEAEGASPAGVQRALAAVRDLPALGDAALVVRDGQSGRVLLDQGGDELRIPASTTKLLSAAAIGKAFAPGDVLRTVVRQGAAPDRIVLVAGGDSLLAPGAGDPEAVAGRAGLRDLARQVVAKLKAAGEQRVTLAVDETYAPGPTTAPTWSSSFRSSGITGAVAMLGLSTQRAHGGSPGPADPVAAVRTAFATQLEALGVAVETAPRDESPTGGAAASGAVLGTVESAPVRDQLALALTDSDNALTEILARQAAFRSGSGTDFAAVGGWVVTEVRALGLDTTGVRLVDASGLSRENRVRASLLSDVLVLGYDGAHPVLRRALDGLPIGGLTGTLAGRFTGSQHDAAGRARAQTGTLTGANALAGSVVDDDGRLLVFVGMVAGTGTNDARAALDRFVAAIASCGCR